VKDGTNDTVPSAVKQVSKLAIGEAYCRARFITAFQYSPDLIRDTKENLMRDVSPVIARAKKATCNEYRAHTIHSFTRDYDVVVAIVVVRMEDEL
jgi:hypothetical protein